MPRNNPKVVQSSMDIRQEWTENCDIQIILYKSDPKVVDPYEILQVTDYVVSYSCKKHKSVKDEQEQIKTIAMM